MGKLLFIRGGAVGDFILTLPAIELVRTALPDPEIEILGYPSISELAVAAGLADRTRSIEMAKLAPFFAPGAELDAEMCEYFAGFDVVVSYLYDPDGYFQGNLERAGVDTLISGPFRMAEDGPETPAPEQLAAPLSRLALFLEKPWIEVSYGEPVADEEGPVIAIHPGSGSPSKNWSLEGWAALADKIAGEIPDVSFRIISGEAEGETIGDFLEKLEASGLRYIHEGEMSLVEVGRCLHGCDLFLGHDSGISHLAASTGVPGLIFFGPSNPGVWAPQHPRFDFIQAPGGQLGNLSSDMIFNDDLFRGKIAELK
ncbi:MAG: glycosyltransferase family 9 protein [Verrucomicrobiales bacterium]|nr:glycosyltransferase family 9 protein [Verrucomicrobiales bacterium]